MKNLMSSIITRSQKGFVSIIALMFLSSVVVFILTQSLSMSGTKGLETRQYSDSVAALALAESGVEVTYASLIKDTALTDNFEEACSKYAVGTDIGIGSGSFRYLKPTSSTTPKSVCNIRVMGTVGDAKRTIETTINFNTTVGSGGYGNSITTTLTNSYPVPVAVVFNSAWQVKSNSWRPSESQKAENSLANASDTTCVGINSTNCKLLWNNRGSGNNTVGSMGSTFLPIYIKGSVTTNHALEYNRNYAEVGLLIGGKNATSPPEYVGSYANSSPGWTASVASPTKGFDENNKIIYYTEGTTINGQFGIPAKGNDPGIPAWCSNADTLVFGVSGGGADPTTEQQLNQDKITQWPFFTNVKFNTTGSSFDMQLGSHFPNTESPYSPDMYGDIFSEIWYRHNTYIPEMKASTNGTTLTVDTKEEIPIGTILAITSGTGAFTGTTQIVSKVPGSEYEYLINNLPTTPLKNARVCTGTCALFGSSSENIFKLFYGNLVTKQWVGGFTCFKGVDSKYIKTIKNSSIRKSQWHEILSGE